MNHPVVVTIPIYKPLLAGYDRVAVQRCFDVLGGHPIVFVKPASLDLSAVADEFPQAKIESFDDRYFRDVASYNALMLSEGFYARFAAYDYLLIYQTDCYVFSDQLSDWCARGYDYVGAPWIAKPLYNNPLYKQYIRLFNLISHAAGLPTRYDIIDRVGNGGLSLRRVEPLRRICAEQRPLIERHIRRTYSSLFHEDVFFGYTANHRLGYRLRIPDCAEALRFAIDINPEEAFRRNDGQLPMGCHGWTKPWGLRFWRRYIDF